MTKHDWWGKQMNSGGTWCTGNDWTSCNDANTNVLSWVTLNQSASNTTSATVTYRYAMQRHALTSLMQSAPSQVTQSAIKWYTAKQDQRIPVVDGVYPIKLRQGQATRIELPDGTVVEVDTKGNFKILDDQAKTVYEANRLREWNQYVSASDVAAEFVRYLGTLGLSVHEARELPFELFINWLIIEAAHQDGEDPPADVRVVNHPALPAPGRRWDVRCLACKRFLPRRLADKQIYVCSPEHLERMLEAA